MAENKTIRKYGWRPDRPDQRDTYYAVTETFAAQQLPLSVDLRRHCPKVYDQGQIGSCTGNAIAAMFQYDEIKQNKPVRFTPSRLFIYYNERVMEGTVNSDAGAAIKDGILSLNKWGACDEALWPYIEAKIFKKPIKAAYTAATKEIVSNYSRIPQDLTSMKSCLAQGFPFVFGFTVYESFESDQVAQTGIVPMPQMSEQELGGHAVMAVGFSDKDQTFIVRNSWGDSWGVGGYCFMPYSYLTDPNLSDDFWTIKFVP